MSNVIKMDFKKDDKMDHEYISESNQIDHKYISGEYVDEWKNSNDIGLENLKNSTRDNGIGHNNNMEEYNIRKRNKRDVTSAMDNNKLLEKYIEKMDRDQSDLRRDIQMSEDRTNKRLSEIEQRMDNRLNRIEDMISGQNDKINNLHRHITQELRDNRKFMWGITISIVALIITVIIGVVQIILSIK